MVIRLAARWVAGCVLVTAALTACSGDNGAGNGDRPSFSPTTSLDLPTPTRTRTASPDVSPEGSEPAPDEETRTPDESPEQSQEPETSTSSGPEDAAADDVADDDAEDTSTWVWWLLGIAAVAVAVWLIARTKRTNAWLAELKEAEAEADWMAYTLLPGLRGTGSLEQVAGGWLVGATRVEAVEDRLTVLESSASRDEDRTRAGGLRDAVRGARDPMQELASGGPHESWARQLDDVIANLQTAVGPPLSAPRS